MGRILGLVSVFVILVSIYITVQSIELLDAAPERKEIKAERAEAVAEAEDAGQNPDEFLVYVDNVFERRFASYDAALEYASQWERAAISAGGQWVWDNLPLYNVFTGGTGRESFGSFAEAVTFARAQERAYVYFRKSNRLLWASDERPKKTAHVEGVPLITQLPELPSGCEVTSLAMLMAYYGENPGKMALAGEIAKDPAKRTVSGGIAHWGDPNVGFVGDMERQGAGYSVNHKPICDLLARYYPSGAMDLSGCEFSDLKRLISSGAPVWVIVNIEYKPLPESAFTVWRSPTGDVRASFSVHSVVITGYDESSVYFNDPLGKAVSAPIGDFAAAWEQMGKQAVALCETPSR